MFAGNIKGWQSVCTGDLLDGEREKREGKGEREEGGGGGRLERKFNTNK